MLVHALRTHPGMLSGPGGGSGVCASSLWCNWRNQLLTSLIVSSWTFDWWDSVVSFIISWQIKDIKSLELIPSNEFALGSCLTCRSERCWEIKRNFRSRQIFGLKGKHSNTESPERLLKWIISEFRTSQEHSGGCIAAKVLKEETPSWMLPEYRKLTGKTQEWTNQSRFRTKSSKRNYLVLWGRTRRFGGQKEELLY